MAKRAIVGDVTYEDAFPIAASDTANVSTYAGNTEGYPHCYIHNVAAGATVRVLPAGASDSATPVTIYIPQGGISALAVKRVYATTPAPPAGLIGFVNLK